MKCLKAFMALGILLALAMSASATTINWIQEPANNTAIKLNILDWTMGKTYDTSGGSLAGPDATDAAALNATPGAQTITKGQVGLGGIGTSLVGREEDTWGVIKIQEIVSDGGATTFWSGAVDTEYELIGLVYGGVDTFAAATTGVFTEIASSAGLFVDVYVQPKGMFDVATGSAGRMSFDQYDGIGWTYVDNDFSGTFTAGDTIVPIAGASLLMSLESTDDKTLQGVGYVADLDVDSDGDNDGDFTAYFNPASAPVGSGTGKSEMFLDLVSGEWFDASGPSMEVNDFYFPNRDPRFGTSQYADLHNGQDFDPNVGPGAVGDWLTTSDDPTRGLYTIPEPMTMAGIMMGLASVGGYVRRRRSNKK